MTTKAKRRWFRFSLSTLLLVVTLTSIWLGWEVNRVWERRALRKLVTDHGGAYLLVADSNPFEAADRYARELSLVQRKLGDDLLRWIELPETLSAAEKERIHRAFPEATFYDASQGDRTPKTYRDL